MPAKNPQKPKMKSKTSIAQKRAKATKKARREKTSTGASKGGIARAKSLSGRRRAQIARKAANVRWAKKKGRKAA